MKKDGIKITYKLVLACLALMIALVFLVTQVFAFFAMQNSVSTGGVSMGVIDVNDVSDSVRIDLIGGIDTNSGKVINPGDYLTAKLTVENKTAKAIQYEFYMSKCNVEYPTIKTGYLYEDKYIDVNSYYINNIIYDYTTDSSVIDKQSFFKGFVRPVTNAIKYNLSLINKLSFVTGEYDPVASVTNNKQVVSFDAINEYILATDTKPSLAISKYGLTLSGAEYVLSGLTGVSVTASGSLKVNANTTAEVYMLLYFDPQIYTTNNSNVELRNSNAYLMQKFWLGIGVSVI